MLYFKRNLIQLIPLFFFSLFVSCSISDKSSSVNFNPELTPFKSLSEYRFFKGNIKQLQPNESVLPYTIITPLFSDYAEKARFIWMPEGMSAKYDMWNTFDFPVGTVLIKNFYYPNDFRDETKGRRIIETRLLVKRSEGWDALAYIWNNDQTDAFLEIAGGTIPVKYTNNKGQEKAFNYSVPDKNQCRSCHSYDGEIKPIGPKARNLNCDYLYPKGVKNQLQKWNEVGYLSTLSELLDSLPQLARWDDAMSGNAEQRALAYLEVNCGHCHNAHGPAKSSGLFLTSDEKNPAHLGICKSPIAAGKGTGGRSFDIVPGKPDRSIIVYRMESTDPSAMMPEVGRKLVHTEGIALVREWITSLNGQCVSE